MATATHERPEAPATVTLVLTEEEALYVYAALSQAEPRPRDRFGDFGDDPAYAALGDALRGAGVSTFDSLNWAGRA